MPLLGGRFLVRPLRTMRRAMGMLIVAVELVAIACALFMSLLLSSWMDSNSFAATATEIDWWIEGAKRIGVVAICATVLSVFMFFVNRHILWWVGVRSGRAALFSAIGTFSLLLCAATVGAITSAITKPFM